MFDAGKIADMILWIPPILLALTVHEFFHGYVAFRLGDPTAKHEGRLTLNPLKHLDPLGTIALVIFHFGWAKPVPVNPYYLRNPRRDMIFVALAGPLSNLAMAILFGILVKFNYMGMVSYPEVLFKMLVFGMYINVILMAFNLIPIPPLDGSKILFGLTDISDQNQMMLQRFGPMILIGIIFLGNMTGFSILSIIISPFLSVFRAIFMGV
ncbi:MAG: site-2 protease family protein [Candidatus Zixiibacteriota bacterium]